MINYLFSDALEKHLLYKSAYMLCLLYSFSIRRPPTINLAQQKYKKMPTIYYNDLHK